MNDRIVFGMVFVGLAVWVATWVYEKWDVRRKRKILNQQIKDGVVPVAYNTVAQVAREQNIEAGSLTTEAQEDRAEDLLALRTKVACIRAEGWDAAARALAIGVLFEVAIRQGNPYEKGSGEAKQWARGFCQEGGHPPKGWMERA